MSLWGEVAFTKAHTKGPSTDAVFTVCGSSLHSNFAGQKAIQFPWVCVDERNWWREAFLFRKAFCSLSMMIFFWLCRCCLMNEAFEAALPLLFISAIHLFYDAFYSTALHLTSLSSEPPRGRMLTHTHTARDRAEEDFIRLYFAPFRIRQRGSKIEFINSPFAHKMKPSKSVICIEIYFYLLPFFPIPSGRLPLKWVTWTFPSFFLHHHQPNWII